MVIDEVRIVDETQDFMGSVVLGGNRILHVHHRPLTRKEKEGADVVLDGRGLVLLPSFVDLHAHMREPGYTYKEDLNSGLSAALAGGFTHLCAMANTDPVMDTREKVEEILHKGKMLDLAELIQVCAVTKGFADDASALVDFQTIRPLTPIFSNDGKNLQDPKVLEEALKASERYDFLLSLHCEPEQEMVQLAVQKAKAFGGHAHICHISTRETVEILKQAKAEGVKVTCEVTPHHLFAWDRDYKVAPPIAKEEDVQALVEAIQEGVVDVLATDHAPHRQEDKDQGAPGISNIEDAFSMYYTVFEQRGLSLQRLSGMLSAKPAQLLGLNTGRVREGMEANLVLVDLAELRTIQPDRYRSKGKNSPFAGEPVKGRIITTIKGGIVKYDHGQIIR